ncbi:MAG: translation initiation factor IF-2 [Planctomycetota bacterium]
MRLHDLAKKLGVSSKEVMAACREQGFQVRTHFVAATPEIVFAMNKVFGGRSAAKVALEGPDAPPRRAPQRKPKAQGPAAEKKAPQRPVGAKKPSPPLPRIPPPPPPAPPQEGGAAPAELPHFEHHAHRLKRANFRSKAKRSIVTPDSNIVSRYEDVAFGTERRIRPRRRRKRRRPAVAQGPRPGVAILPRRPTLRKRVVTPEGVLELTPPVTPRALSAALGIKLDRLIKLLIDQGAMVGINDTLPDELVGLVAMEHQKEVKFIRPRDLEEEVEASFSSPRDASRLVSRPPVVAFLGHVDHGKTSLLDYIRKSRVVDTEAGGITQHIGAYRITIDRGPLCFLDTPGHEAFSAMRARGANVTDMVVLVCAADDGLMPQAREAYAHAKAAEVPVVVAINKCDLPNANPQRVMQELAALDEALLPEAWGGKTGMVQVSALTGQNIDELLERLLLEAELLELRSDPGRPAEGHVLEAKLTPDRGIVANVLILDGTLHRGDIILAGAGFGKVKLMFDENGHTVLRAGPATPVSVTGLSEMPEAGDRFYVLSDLQKARVIAAKRSDQARSERLTERRHVSLDNLSAYLKGAEAKELRIVLKADVMGSLEVLKKTLSDLSTQEVKLKIIHAGVGGINRADVILADASDAIVVGFHVTSDAAANAQAEGRKVEIKIYHIIYRMMEDIKAALEGLLPPEKREIVQGRLVIREIFRSSRLGNIAGCFVQTGTVTRTSRVRLFRDNILVHDGRLSSLQRFKDQVREVREGFECGLRIEGYDNIRPDDTLEAYTTEEVARTFA